jgi:hypothetical protein
MSNAQATASPAPAAAPAENAVSLPKPECEIDFGQWMDNLTKEARDAGVGEKGIAELHKAMLEQKVLDRDKASDGAFVYAVRTTGVYCRPSCPSRRGKRENVQFFDHCEDAERASFRPCMRCKPHLSETLATQNSTRYAEMVARAAASSKRRKKCLRSKK